MKQPIKIKNDYNDIYEIFEDKIVVKNPQGEVILNFVDDCEYLEQAIFIYRKLKEKKGEKK